MRNRRQGGVIKHKDPETQGHHSELDRNRSTEGDRWRSGDRREEPRRTKDSMGSVTKRQERKLDECREGRVGEESAIQRTRRQKDCGAKAGVP